MIVEGALSFRVLRLPLTALAAGLRAGNQEKLSAPHIGKLCRTLYFVIQFFR